MFSVLLIFMLVPQIIEIAVNLGRDQGIIWLTYCYVHFAAGTSVSCYELETQK